MASFAFAGVPWTCASGSACAGGAVGGAAASTSSGFAASAFIFVSSPGFAASALTSTSVFATFPTFPVFTSFVVVAAWTRIGASASSTNTWLARRRSLRIAGRGKVFDCFCLLF